MHNKIEFPGYEDVSMLRACICRAQDRTANRETRLFDILTVVRCLVRIFYGRKFTSMEYSDVLEFINSWDTEDMTANMASMNLDSADSALLVDGKMFLDSFYTAMSFERYDMIAQD